MEQLQCIFDMILKYLPIAVLIGGVYKFYKLVLCQDFGQIKLRFFVS